MKKRKLIHWLCLSGMVGLAFYLLHDVVGGRYYPGYGWMRQAVSDLTALTSPSFQIAGGLSSVYGLFACLCCVLACLVIQGKGNRLIRLGVYLFAVMNWVSGIGYSLFPLSDSGYAGQFLDIMHMVVTILVVLLSMVSLVLLTVGGFRHPGGRSLAVFSMIALACMCFGAMGVAVFPEAYFGLIERFGTYSAVAFNAVLGLYAFADFPGLARVTSA